MITDEQILHKFIMENEHFSLLEICTLSDDAIKDTIVYQMFALDCRFKDLFNAIDFYTGFINKILRWCGYDR